MKYAIIIKYPDSLMLAGFTNDSHEKLPNSHSYLVVLQEWKMLTLEIKDGNKIYFQESKQL